MYSSLLTDARLYRVLADIDADLAAMAREEGCGTCGGVVHRADYARKPRGGPAGVSADFELRHSFCCARDGCRKRLTPPSVRFLGRKVYLGAVIVLVTALRHGPTPWRLSRLREICGASARTLERWRRWWREAFAASAFWKAFAGSFATPVAVARLPLSLLERFGGDEGERLVAMLRFLCPITTASARNAMAF